MFYFAFMHVCISHTCRVPMKSEESIGLAWNWISCLMGTRNPILRRAASVPAPKLNCFNKVEMVVYACNMNTWLRQEDDHRNILNTELTESTNLSYSLKITNKKIF